MEQTRPVQVLVALVGDAEAHRLMRMLKRARGQKFAPSRARLLSEVHRVLAAGGAGIALLDVRLPDAQGVSMVAETLRVAPGVPLVVLSPRPDDSLAAAALQQGAQDVLALSDLSGRLLARSLCHAILRQRLQATLLSLSLNDELTGLYNRRGFVTLAESRQRLAAREGARTSLIFGDFDDLKRVNDTFGHREGDRALQDVADVFRECFRDSDIVARIGGDEFCVMLSDASESSEMVIRERLRRALDARNARGHRPYRVSLSLGIVRVSGPADFETQLAHADAKMYEHKRNKSREEPQPAMNKTSPV